MVSHFRILKGRQSNTLYTSVRSDSSVAKKLASVSVTTKSIAPYLRAFVIKKSRRRPLGPGHILNYFTEKSIIVIPIFVLLTVMSFGAIHLLLNKRSRLAEIVLIHYKTCVLEAIIIS